MTKPSRKSILAAGDRVALAVQYDGSAFAGWQQQRSPAQSTVQETLQAALSKVADAPIAVQCAGRTDSGVHASHQLVHFDAPCSRPETAWVLGGNSHLPASLSIKWVSRVPEQFHARFSATARRYRYIIYNAAIRPSHLATGVTWIADPLDAELMHNEAQVLVGEQDFSSFRAANCQSNTPMRNVHRVSVRRSGELVVIDIEANAFLYHMVRNIVGVLVSVGRGEQVAGWTRQVLEFRDRTLGGVTAPPFGLYLVDVTYPAEFRLPKEEVGPFFVRELLR